MAFDNDQMEMILAHMAEDPVTAMVTWQQLEKDLAFSKRWEMDFRKRLFGHYFPTYKKGVNTMPLQSNYLLKGTAKVNVSIDEKIMPVVRGKLEAMNVNINDFLKWKASVGTGYTALQKDEEVSGPSAVGAILREMITTTPGAPELEIVLPAKFSK